MQQIQLKIDLYSKCIYTEWFHLRFKERDEKDAFDQNSTLRYVKF